VPRYVGDTEREWDMFKAGLVEAWAAILDSLITQLIMSMPRRLDTIIKAHGF
jgi:hypothetical protein